jgi:hypothetical protein
VTIPSDRLVETQDWLNAHHGSGHGLPAVEDAGHPTGTWKRLVCPCGARHTTVIDKIEDAGLTGERCSTCHGTGYHEARSGKGGCACPECLGTGLVNASPAEPRA